MSNIISKRLVTLAVQAALAIAIAPAVMATPQETTTPTTQLGEIQVTGLTPVSLAPTSVKPVGPVQVITHQQIQDTGLTSIGDILSRLSIFGNGINSTANFGANGESCINLRGLGCNRVLVLVNGKRWPSLITGEVDMNTIPVAIIDHIEILKSGGSAEYGSGAVAGVVNIVTKNHFNGNEASAYFGQYQDGGERDGNTSTYEFTHGITTDKSSSIFNASYTYQQPVTKGQRPITEFPNPGTGVTRGSGVPLNGIYKFIPPSTSPLYNNGMCPPNAQGVPLCNLTIIAGTPGTSISDYRPFNATTDTYNYATANYLQTPQKRVGLYGQGTYQFNDNISGHYTALYNDRRSEQQGGPAEATVGTTGNVPYNIPADQPYNPFGFDLNSTGPNANLLLLGNQPVETGLRYWNEDSQTFYLNAGLDGDFRLGSQPFSWSVDGIANRNTMNTTDGPETNLERWALALGGPSVCGPGSPNPTCVPVNMFGPAFYNGSGSITPAMWNYVSYTANSYIQTDEKDWSAHISTPIVQLPAGPLQGTLEYDYQNSSGRFTPDALAALGESTLGTSPGANSGPPVSGGYNMNAGSLFFNVPILADVPGFKFLNLDAATRYTNYNIFGSNHSNLAALHWSVNDLLAFRASWSQDFNAPTIQELFSAQVVGSTTVNDPCSNYQAVGGAVAANCAAAGVPTGYTQPNVPVNTTSGANPHLKPENSTSRTVGATWQIAESVPLRLSVDYFKIEIANAIGSIDPQSILNGCYIAGASNICSLISRNSSGTITNLDTGNVNLGRVLTEGADFGANYILTTQSAGTFNFDWETTWVKLYTTVQPNFSNPAQPIITQFINQQLRSAAYPRFKSFLTADWSYGGWQVQWQLQYIGDLIESCSDRFDNTPLSFTNLGLCSYPNYTNNKLSMNKIGATTFNNVQAKYHFDTGTTLSVGINNVFNKEPPISHVAGGYNTTLYPIPGRFPYISISQTF